MRKTIATCLVYAFLASCGGDDSVVYSNDVTVEPTVTRGAIVGRVEDLTGGPIVEAVASVVLGDDVRIVTTGEDGVFVLDGLPGGSDLAVRIEADGFLPARIPAWIPNAAGKTPVDGATATVGPVVLFANDGRVEFELYALDGARLVPPSGSCSVNASWLWYDFGVRRMDGPLTVPARNEEGRMVCDGLPSLVALAQIGGWIEFAFEAIDVDGDGLADYEGVSGSRDAQLLLTSGDPIVRLYPGFLDGELELVASNVPELLGGHAEDAPIPADTGIEIVFSRPVRGYEAQIRSHFGGEHPGFDLVEEGNRVRLVPEGAPWPAGQIFDLHLIVAPRGIPFAATNLEAVFWTSSDELPRLSAFFEDTNADGRLNAGETLVLAFSEYLRNYYLDPTGEIGVQFDVDLDGSGTVGDQDAEYGADGVDQATSSAAEMYRSLGDRYYLTWFDADLDAGTAVAVRFDLFPSCGSAHQAFLTEEIRAEIEAVAP